MSLKGTLGAFSIADIFQLIGHQQKSGVLFVRNPDNEARFFFADGKVVLATMTGARQDLLLGSLLLRAGAVTKAQIEKALLAQKAAPKSLGEILVVQKALDIEVLKEFLSLQLDEILTEVIQWDAGNYEFIPENITFNQQLLSARSTEGLLMECFRRKDEWPMIIQKISSPDVIFKNRITSETPLNELEESEMKLLEGLTTGKSLKEISFTSRMGTFETCRAAAMLLDKGLISPAGQTTKFEISSQEIGITVDYKQLLMFTVFGFAVGYLLANPRSLLHIKTYPGKINVGRAVYLDFSPQEIAHNEEKKNLEKAADRYYLSQGHPPKSVNELNTEFPHLEIQEDGNTFNVIRK